MKTHTFSILMLAFVLLCTINPSFVEAETNKCYLDRNHYLCVSTDGISLMTEIQPFSAISEEQGTGTLEDMSVSVNCSMKRVTVSGRVSWEVINEGTGNATNQLTFMMLNQDRDLIDEYFLSEYSEYMEYIDQITLDSSGEFSFVIPLGGMREPVFGKEYYIYIGSWMLAESFAKSFIYESAALSQIKINGNILEGFKFDKTAYNNLTSDEINTNTKIEVILEDPQAIVTVGDYDTALQRIAIDVSSRNGAEVQQYSLSIKSDYGSNNNYLLPIEPPVAGSIPISNKIQLSDIRNNLNGKYHLTANIDLSGELWEPIGGYPDCFTGTFDGQGYVIRNLAVNETWYNGLFGYISGATIKNVGLEDTNINIFSFRTIHVGGISGYSGDSSIISNCYNTGTVSASSSGFLAYAGGISGRNYGATINNCYNTGNISASYDAITTHLGYHAFAGGISGNNTSDGVISNSYNTGTVSANSSAVSNNGNSSIAGGIAGSNSSAISNCYNIGALLSSVTATSSNTAYAGAISGSNSGFSSTVSNSYWNIESSQKVNGIERTNIEKKGIGDGADATKGLTTNEMKIQSSFIGFDFDNIWTIIPNRNNGYPILRSLTSTNLDREIKNFFTNGNTYKFDVEFTNNTLDYVTTKVYAVAYKNGKMTGFSTYDLIDLADDSSAIIENVTINSSEPSTHIKIICVDEQTLIPIGSVCKKDI